MSCKSVLAEPLQEECYLDGLPERVHCGSINVPEDYSNPGDKLIQVHYAVIPAIKESRGYAPLLAISGGPGQSAIDQAGLFSQVFYEVRQSRDLILIDQRGTGKSNILSCSDEELLGNDLSINDELVNREELARKCLEEQDADVAHYGSLSALRDFELVRKHLNYDRWHLYGISYGTRMAQLYMRHYPDQVATVTLDGVVPMQQSVITIGHAINRAFDQVLQDCRSSRQCNKQYPGLDKQFQAVANQLSKEPVKTTVLHPLTATKTEFLVTRSKFLGSLRMAMYSPGTRSLIPYTIDSSDKGHYLPLLGLFKRASDIDMAMGMHIAVICGEDYPRLTPGQKHNLEKSSVIAAQMVSVFEEICPVWQIPAVADEFSSPVNSAIPTLLLSGELDPATPPAWGDMASEKLTNALHLVAPYGTHGVAFQSCAPKLIRQVIESGSVDDLDSRCLDKDARRAFYLSANSVESEMETPND